MKEHLRPHQLAVSVRAGSEVMSHLAREWPQQHCNDPARLMVDSDESNAHNEVDRHTFLLRMREVCPGVSRWLEFIYPTDCPTMVFHKDHEEYETAARQHSMTMQHSARR